MTDNEQLLGYLKSVAADLYETREQLRKLESGAQEPMAVVGMACRYPGGVESPEDLWDVVAGGRDVLSAFPTDRGWDTGTGTGTGGQGQDYAPVGGFVHDAADFDPAFFGISPREALAMDPQQRMLLEVAWESLERSGIDPRSLRGSPTGVFVGAAMSGYAEGLGAAQGSEGYVLTGNTASVVSGRVSYVLGLEGPAVTVDTACSSSLVALHVACQAVRAGECDMALAGGVAVLVTPGAFAEFSRQRGMAADGRCKAFAGAADGIGWAEGAGMVVIERLSTARRKGHRVLALIAGSAMNQDGASNGLTAPNGPSQQRLIRAALANARLDAHEVDAVEAHGTGTTLGDPIEAQALLATYGKGRPDERPLWLGSVKSNIGHAQQAAGVAGVIKAVMALRHAVLPTTLHVDEPTPHVDWSAGAVRLLTEAVPWPQYGRPRRAGVSAFGVSGTNVHTILEQAPEPQDAAAEEPGPREAPDGAGDGPARQSGTPPVLGPGVDAPVWLVSGRSPEGLAAQAERLRAFAAGRPELHQADVAWSLATTRSTFEHRAVVTGTGRADLLAGLAALAATAPAPGLVAGDGPVAGRPGRVAFVFPGQGGQWAGMGAELTQASPVFAARLAACEEALAPHTDWSLREVLAAGARAHLDRVDVVQPALWAVMVSLAAVWQAAGITPKAVVGHSQGEIAAAVVAGALSLEDGARVVALRSRALRALAGRGGMMSIAAGEDAVRDRIASYGGRVSVAALNGPAATVVSGEPAALEELAAACGAEGVRARVLPVDYASHSPQVEELEAEIRSALAGISPRAGRVPMVSSMTGEPIDGTALDAGYWYASLRAPVRFGDAVTALAGSGHTVFVEASPHPVLTGAVADTVHAADPDAESGGPVVTGTLRRDEGGPARLLTSFAEAHVRGVPVDWTRVLPAGSTVDLPTYPFQHQRYWQREGTSAGDLSAAGLGAIGHPLLAAAVVLADGGGLVLTGRLSTAAQPWLADHAVNGTVVFPGTAFVELALQAGHRAGCGHLAELTLETPLVLPRDGATQLQVVLGPADPDGRRTFETYARPDTDDPDRPWTRHAGGLLAAASPTPRTPDDGGPDGPDDLTAWPPPGAVPVDVSGLYGEVAAAGYGYGPAFQGLRAVWRRGRDVFAEVALPEDVADSAGRFGLHPALLDATLHASAVAAGQQEDPAGVRLPFAWQDVALRAAGAGVLRARLRPAADGALSLTAADGTGAPVVSVGNLVLRPVSAGQLAASGGGRQDALFGVAWEELPASAAPAGRWAVVGDDTGGLRAELAGSGADIAPYPDLAALAAAVGAGGPAPDVVLAPVGADPRAALGDDVVPATRETTVRTLALLQEWLAAEELGTARLALVTRGAVAARSGEGVTDLAGAAVWGMVRSAQTENPGRLVLADLPAVRPAGSAQGARTGAALAAGLAGAEPELVVRDGAVRGRRLTRPRAGLDRPEDGMPWRLENLRPGALDGLALVPRPQAAAPLEPGQVRIAVRAAALGTADVAAVLDPPAVLDTHGADGTSARGGAYAPGGDRAAVPLGREIAGVVLETGDGVGGLAPGDRVLGLAPGGAGPLAVTDARLLAPVPDGWTFARAAAAPGPYLAAWYALADVAGVRPGQHVLLHAGADGTGVAAVHVAHRLGLEVHATAGPEQFAALQAAGLDEAHLAPADDTSHLARFEAAVMAATGGDGVAAVLDASEGGPAGTALRLLSRGGALVTLGTGRAQEGEAAAAVAQARPDVRYARADLDPDVGPDLAPGPGPGPGGADTERLGRVLGDVADLLADGALPAPPYRAWDVRRAADAVEAASRAPSDCRTVLTVPRDGAAPRPPGTVLVTGGTGLIGGLVAGHLAAAGQARRVVLTSRSGPAAPGAAVLAAAVAGRGADVRIAVCDAADRSALAAVLDAIPPSAPLTGVMHAAGVLDDGVIGSLTPRQVDVVLRPKSAAAWNLHRLTLGHDLDRFVMFSSAAATLGSAGQGNYAAANAFLDALAARRQADGRPATSLAWGFWADASAMTGHLGTGERARISRGGVRALSADEGLDLLDLATARDEPLLVPAGIDVPALRAQVARGDVLPPLWQVLAGRATRLPSAAAGGAVRTLRHTLAAMAPAEQDRTLLDLVRSHAAAVLGHASPDAIEAGKAFKDIGFDSLTAVELRNRLGAATGLRLTATLVFDYPTSAALAAHLRSGLVGEQPATAGADPAAPPPPVDDDPIAIVAMSCRFPGDVQDPESFWDLLDAGRDVIADCPANRGWDTERLYDPDRDHPGTAYTLQGGYLSGVGDFDTGFFGISPREALAMDPQQRLLLETAWEALERAAIAPDSLRGSAAGVFVGATSSGYNALLPDDAAGSEGYLMTGSAVSVISGRIAYALGLEGPAMTVDTACSSALVALHLACQALRAGECRLALAGGVTIMSTPAAFTEFSQQRGLAADGRCKPFGAAADGTGWGEGAGLVVLERLSDARRNGHPVLAVVAGSAVNQDGASNGLTAPNGPSQQRVIRAALAGAGLRADQVDAVEAHGTGTVLGDPIEAQALLATYGQGRADGRPLWLGSVKSNIGHTQAAAGVAGVIKMVLALHHGRLPATLHAEQPSPHVDWSAGDVRLLTEPVEWPAGDEPRRAGVSSFGLSGTNAHLIVAEPPPVPGAGAHGEGASGADTSGADVPAADVPAVDASGTDASGTDAPDPDAPGTGTHAEDGAAGPGLPPVPWVLSGRGADGLRAQAARLLDHLDRHPELDAPDVGFSLATTRSAFSRRAVVIGSDRAELLAGLAAVAAPGAERTESGEGEEDGTRAQDAGRAEDGQGAAERPDRGGSGHRVVTGTAAPAMAQSRVAFVLPALDGATLVAPVRQLLDQATAFGTRMAECDRALAAHLGWSVTDVLRERPGAPSLREDGVARAVGFAVQVALAALWRSAGLVPAAVAGAGSGEIAAAHVAGVLTLADAARIAAGSATPRTDPVAPAPGTLPLMSLSTASWLEGEDLDTAYWCGPRPEPGPARAAAEELHASGYGVLVEISTDPAATADLRAVAPEGRKAAAVNAAGALGPGRSGLPGFLAGLADLYVRGTAVDWASVWADTAPRQVALPTYAFQHQWYWPSGMTRRGPAGVDGTAGAAAADAPADPRTPPGAGGDASDAGGFGAVEDELGAAPDTSGSGDGDGAGAGVARPASDRRSPVGEPLFWAAVAQEDLAALGGLLGAGEPLRADTPLSEVLARLSAWHRAAGDPVPAAPGQPAEGGATGSGPGVGADPAADTDTDTDACTYVDDGGADGDDSVTLPVVDPQWSARLAGLDPAAQEAVLLDLVRAEIAVLLGYASDDLVEAEGDILEMGMSSMAAVQLRERLAGLIGLELPEGFMYDLESPAVIAEYLAAEYAARPGPRATAPDQPL
ncbi:putative polyketide synthase [Actinacidiphila reveromycinica]|uniref:Putative polyketide synthase n=1 Tax=Actinacidiphila reveromycinica TaxID=659352 RepID=A0A7U3UXU9_9ACTN|nr:type I polyketide synthase [Streptomyces sp. SN-593]BBB02256.1 putative polyketide synthase [Streptomyces sp. SN-593]